MLLLFWLEFFLQACLFLLVQRKYLKIFFLFLSKDDFNFLDSSTLPASLTEICPSLCPSLCLHYSFFYFLLFPFPIFRLSVPFTPSIPQFSRLRRSSFLLGCSFRCSFPSFLVSPYSFLCFISEHLLSNIFLIFFFCFLFNFFFFLSISVHSFHFYIFFSHIVLHFSSSYLLTSLSPSFSSPSFYSITYLLVISHHSLNTFSFFPPIIHTPFFSGYVFHDLWSSFNVKDLGKCLMHSPFYLLRHYHSSSLILARLSAKLQSLLSVFRFSPSPYVFSEPFHSLNHLNVSYLRPFQSPFPL
ncbi:unnamed protein product [Acanthosepion pharaonis]|uniref:Uncharacterized protein n=1 Tax=Acanthosepion pharaonis TaxID=158019 RepID=A0A812BSZ4_ACAPH|nr:unnamed protein product [Sepia pharaonis]